MSNNSPVSDREREILRLIATGATNQQIANSLDISVNTVKVHIRNIFAKIDVASRAEAAMYAARVGLVSLGEPAAVPLPSAPVEAPGGSDSLGDMVVIASGPESAVAPDDTAVDSGQSVRASLDVRSLRAVVRTIYPELLLVVGSLILIATVLVVVPRTVNTPAPVSSPTAQDGQRWGQLPPMPIGLAAFGMAGYSYDGRSFLYALGGDRGASPSDAVYRYDLSTSVWVPMSRKPTAVTDIRAAVVGGLVFVPGGRLASGTISAVLEAYDPQHDSWRTLAPMPSPRSAYALAVVEGKLYVIGGWDGASYRSEVWQYSPDDDKWSSRSPMPTARGYAAAAVLEQTVLVVGGEGASGALATTEKYAPSADRGAAGAWSTQTPAPMPISHADAGAAGGLLAVVAADRSEARLLVYSGQTDVWNVSVAPIATLPDGRVQMVGGRLYVAGGRIGEAASDRVLQYQVLTSIFLPSLP